MASLPIYRAKPDWAGATVVVIGNGTSVLGLDLKPIARAGAKAMVANGGWKTWPKADVLMCSDRHFLAASPDLSGYQGPMIVVTRPEAVAAKDRRMVAMRRCFVERVHGDPWADRGRLIEGHTSTTTNMSLAVLRGAARIVLVGIDLVPGPGNRRRATDEETDDPARAAPRYARQVEHITAHAKLVRAAGVEVVNASPRSALTCYPYAGSLKEALA